MPIKPEFRHLYRGPVWRAIRERILARAGKKCERCGVPNHIQVVRYESMPGWAYEIEDGEEYSPAGPTGQRVRGSEMPAPDRVVRIVLTIAHLNHEPTDNRDENLAALCQWCHNHHDVTFRQGNARETRTTRKDAARPLLAVGERWNCCDKDRRKRLERMRDEYASIDADCDTPAWLCAMGQLDVEAALRLERNEAPE